MSLLGIFIILGLKFCLTSCQSECKNMETCGGCIGYVYSNCLWCSADNHVGRRCKSKIDHEKEPTWCKQPVYDPQPQLLKVSDKEFNNSKNTADVVQFKPQYMKIKVRPGVPVDFKMSYKPAKDYPLDIYFLMDYSYTMLTYAQELQKQGTEIYKQLTNITNNVQFGLGAYVEKPALPYAEPRIHNAYAFKNLLPLTKDMKMFANALSKEPDGSNIDLPEADLDALMQAMVCKKEIGWRDFANRIIILSTDSPYHSAGDGKFVGAVKPHDMKCHLTKNEYTMALELDYPSISQINKVATDNNIMIFFAAINAVKEDYLALEYKIKNAKYVLLFKSADMVKRIVDIYTNTVSSVQLKHNIDERLMSITYEPDCNLEGKCQYKHNKPVEVKGTLIVRSCPTNNQFKHIVQVGPVSLDERLTLEIDIDCECDCEKSNDTSVRIKKAEQCNKFGTYQCGVCKCDEGRYGNDCNCTGASTSTQDLEKCKANSDDSSYCSGRGTCRCGKCFDCQEGFSGNYCEFDDTACPRADRLLCSGHGKCTFGKCACDPHWLNDDCSCPDNDRGCIAPLSTELCSGKGECKCGVCECNRSNGSEEYCAGRFCDQCEELVAKRCKELEYYAYCNFQKNQTDCNQEYESKFNDTDVKLVSKEEIYSHVWHMVKLVCRKEIKDQGILVFKYHYSTTKTINLLLIIQNELDKPPVPEIWVAVGSAIGAVLLIGIVTVIVWKVLVDLHDKREYEKFSKESEAAGFDVSLNPLYNPPAINFENPAYSG